MARTTALARGEHGTISAYNTTRCRCRACVDAWRRYQRERWAVRAVERGVDPEWKVPVHKVAAHVRNLRASGLSVDEIARRARLGPATIWRLLAPNTKAAYASTARALFEVQP